MKARSKASVRKTPPCPTALVLTGGGAHGAYEAGVLKFIFDRLPNKVGQDRLFDLFAGTSAGALNACTLASMAHDPCQGVTELVDYWHSVTMESLLKFGPRELARLPSVVMGRKVGFDFLRTRKRPPRPKAAPHPPVTGVFDTTPLYQDMIRMIPWDRLQENIQKGVVRGIAVCATEVCTSKSVVFYQVGRKGMYCPGTDVSREERPVQMNVEHAMASAAIPFLFPAVQIEGVCYVDGALRQNIPLHPAIRMSAEKILVIGLSREPDIKYRTARMGCRRNPFPGSLFLLGRTVKAVMDGILDYELHRIEMFNQFLLQGEAAYGDSFLKTLNKVSKKFRNADYRLIQIQHVRPSKNLNDLAIEALQEAPDEIRLPGAPGRLIKEVMTSSPFVESQLSSFLMFTPTFVRKLIRLGYEDAKRQQDELTDFFS